MHYAALFLPNSNICVLDSELLCERNIESCRLLLALFFHKQGSSSLRRFSTHASLFCLSIVQLQIHITLQLVFYQFFTTVVTKMVITNKFVATKANSFQQVLSFNKASFLAVFYLYFSYHDWLLASFSLINDFATSHSNDFILYCTYLSNESCLENDFFKRS